MQREVHRARDDERLGREAAGCQRLIIHAESTLHLHRVLSRIRELGRKAGVVLDPASPIAFVEEVLHLCDIVLVMTVEPGFGGQSFIPSALDKLKRVRAMILKEGWLGFLNGLASGALAGAAMFWIALRNCTLPASPASPATKCLSAFTYSGFSSDHRRRLEKPSPRSSMATFRPMAR